MELSGSEAVKERMRRNLSSAVIKLDVLVRECHSLVSVNPRCSHQYLVQILTV